MESVIGTIWVCVDCMLMEANGECDPDRPADLAEPLSAIDGGYRVTLGMSSEAHDGECPVRIEGDHNAAECDCERIEFSQGWCEGCGTALAGSRHAMTLWGPDA